MVAFAIGASPASAHNIPGSAASALPQATEVATGMIVRSLKSHILPLREAEAGGAIAFSTSGGTFSARSDEGLSFALGLDYRNLEGERLEGGLGVGTLFIAKALNARNLVIGGIVAERLDSDTPYNEGRITSKGLGLSFGADYRLNDRFFLTSIFGLMKLDYELSRNKGAITGNFDARRGFIDLSGDYLLQSDPAEITLGLGLLYVHQKNNAYVESGGAAVAGFTSKQLSGKLALRSLWGKPGQLRPLVEAETWVKLSGTSGLPALLAPGDTRDWTARLGLGLQKVDGLSAFDLGLGSNFGEEGFEGLDLRLHYARRF